MKLNVTLEQAKHFVKTGEVVLVVLKKEEELVSKFVYFDKSLHKQMYKWELKGEFKLKVGSVRSLCNKEKKLWWCPACLNSVIPLKTGVVMNVENAVKHNKANITTKAKPLQFTIEQIEEKKLLDITEKESHKTGFPKKHGSFTKIWFSAKLQFLIHFQRLHYKDIKRNNPKHASWMYAKDGMLEEKEMARDWNPDVWLIKGKVKE